VSITSADPKQRITYSFHDVETTIIGKVEEINNLLCLYEYRGKYIGTEFLISFSKHSVSYKLISVEDELPDSKNVVPQPE
jgi:predicted  nucleic acid-binding Zn ribbon protein